MDVEESSQPRASVPEAKGTKKTDLALKTIVKQTAGLGSFMADMVGDSFSLSTQVANFEGRYSTTTTL
jgi:hypothetical protein